MELEKTMPNLYNLNELKKLQYKNITLNNFKNLREKFKYHVIDDKDSNEIDNIKRFQNRVLKYSEGIISHDFPFNPEKYIIAGGFVANIIIGVFSDFTDIDIYIFEDFEESVKKIISYFSSFLKIEMTATKSVINIYAIGYKTNIQLIYLQLNPEKIIEDFDVTYSQMAIYNWNEIKMTKGALDAILTGYFKLNINSIIRPYRILKGYVKGLKLIDSDFNFEENEQNFKFGLLDDVKYMISRLKRVKDDDEQFEDVILDFLSEETNEYKLMTKNVYLGENINSMSFENKIKYIENLSMCKYFTMESFNPDRFESLKYYSYNYDLNTEKSISSFPYMEKIVIRKAITGFNYKKILHNKDTLYLYRLVVNTGEYYPNPVSLTSFQFSFNIKLKDIKLVGISGDNTSLKFIIDYENIDEKQDLKNLLRQLDSRMLSLSKEIVKYQPTLNSNIIFESFGKNKKKFKTQNLNLKEECIFIASANPITLCQYIEQTKNNFYNKINNEDNENSNETNKGFDSLNNSINDVINEQKTTKNTTKNTIKDTPINNTTTNTNVNMNININILKSYICKFRELLYNNKYPHHKINHIRLSTLLPHEMKTKIDTHNIKVYVNGIWNNKKDNIFGYNLSILF